MSIDSFASSTNHSHSLQLITDVLPLLLEGEDLLPPESQQVVRRLLDVLPVLGDDLAGGPGEDEVDLLERLVLGLRHEEHLVKPTEDGDAAVEAERQTGARHGVHHAVEVVRDDEGRQEEPSVGGGHTVGTEVSWIHLHNQLVNRFATFGEVFRTSAGTTQVRVA